MASKLNKDLVRKTTVIVNEREIILTLGMDQTIMMKLKGMKSGHVSISIGELYEQLTGITVGSPVASNNEVVQIETSSPVIIPPKKIKHKDDDAVMISLHELRSRFNTSGFDYPITAKIDTIINGLIEETEKENLVV